MKNFLAIVAVCFALSVLCGCGFARLAVGLPAAAPEMTRPAAPPSTPTVHETVKKQVAIFWAVGLLCLLAAGGLAYAQMYFMALKFFLAGLLLPIFGTWYSAHYAWIIAGALISVAVVAWVHWRVVLNPLAKDLIEKLKPK